MMVKQFSILLGRGGGGECFAIIFTHHPPALVRVNPKRESLSTDTRIPTIPSPCSVTTWPRITATRLLQIKYVTGDDSLIRVISLRGGKFSVFVYSFMCRR